MQGYHKALTVLLIVYIGIFCFLFFALPERSFSAAENRFLQTRPVLSRQKLLSGQFSQAAEKYLADQFVLRDSWIRLKACFELLLQKMDHRGVYFGRDGYLLQKPQRREKEQLEQNISAVSNFAQQAGKSVYFLLAPVSAQILREKLPRYAVPPIVGFAVRRNDCRYYFCRSFQCCVRTNRKIFTIKQTTTGQAGVLIMHTRS